MKIQRKGKLSSRDLHIDRDITCIFLQSSSIWLEYSAHNKIKYCLAMENNIIYPTERCRDAFFSFSSIISSRNLLDPSILYRISIKVSKNLYHPESLKSIDRFHYQGSWMPILYSRLIFQVWSFLQILWGITCLAWEFKPF